MKKFEKTLFLLAILFVPYLSMAGGGHKDAEGGGMIGPFHTISLIVGLVVGTIIGYVVASRMNKK